MSDAVSKAGLQSPDPAASPFPFLLASWCKHLAHAVAAVLGHNRDVDRTHTRPVSTRPTAATLVRCERSALKNWCPIRCHCSNNASLHWEVHPPASLNSKIEIPCRGLGRNPRCCTNAIGRSWCGIRSELPLGRCPAKARGWDTDAG